MTQNESLEGKELVLVTGGSGFIASRCIIQLLGDGYRVRTTVRSMKKAEALKEVLKSGGALSMESLSFAEADLLSDTGWSEAVKDCDYVLHVASPFPPGLPKHEDDLILPAREGAKRVLRASRDAGVKRVVMTSSFAAVGYGNINGSKPFTEESWTDPSAKDITAYVKSKTFAEMDAWEFMKKEGGSLELAVINPVGVLGPVLSGDYSASIEVIKRLLDGSVPGYPHISFGFVDVRDVAELHIMAMKNPAAKGERFLAISGNFLTMKEVGNILRSRLGERASKVPKLVFPDWMVRLTAKLDPSIAQVVPELGKVKNATNEKAVRVLGWKPRTPEDAIIATAESLIRLDLVKKK